MNRAAWMGGVALLVAFAIAGCSPVSPVPHRASPTPTAQAIAEPAALPATPAQVCGSGIGSAPPSSSVWLGANGAWFDTGLVGSSDDTTVAVLVHQSDRDYCGWWRYAQYLAAHGVRSVMLDLCGYGDTRCPAHEPVIGSGAAAALVAARWARTHGATRVVAVGAAQPRRRGL